MAVVAVAEEVAAEEHSPPSHPANHQSMFLMQLEEEEAEVELLLASQFASVETVSAAAIAPGSPVGGQAALAEEARRENRQPCLEEEVGGRLGSRVAVLHSAVDVDDAVVDTSGSVAVGGTEPAGGCAADGVAVSSWETTGHCGRSCPYVAI